MKILEVMNLIEKIDTSPAAPWILAAIIGLMLFAEQKLRHDALTKRPKTRQQKEAQDPPISKRWRKKIPQGLVLGRVSKHEYFCVPEVKTDHGFSIYHCLVMGGSGTGKTSSV